MLTVMGTVLMLVVLILTIHKLDCICVFLNQIEYEQLMKLRKLNEGNKHYLIKLELS